MLIPPIPTTSTKLSDILSSGQLQKIYAKTLLRPNIICELQNLGDTDIYIEFFDDATIGGSRQIVLYNGVSTDTFAFPIDAMTDAYLISDTSVNNHLVLTFK